jgi:hypothetical protein
MNTVPAARRSNIITIYALTWIAVYLVLVFVLRDYLPEKFLRDSLTIQRLAEDLHSSDWGGAYAIAAKMSAIFPSWFLNIIVAVVGGSTIWYVTTSAKSIRGMLLIVPILAPAIVLDMVQFGKEVFVIPLTFIILVVAQRTPSILKAFLVIAAIYLLYGLFFRQYYLLIFLAFIAFMVTVKSPPPFRLVYLLLLMIVIVAVPSKVFMQLQGDRDSINMYSNLVTNEVRTAIYNPYVPDGGVHFLINYAYAFLRLNLPILFSPTVSDILLFINVLIYGRMVYGGIKQRPITPMSLLPWLFLSHLVVLWVFEPDLGSYLRHFSSIIVYIIPAFREWEQRRFDKGATLEPE